MGGDMQMQSLGLRSDVQPFSMYRVRDLQRKIIKAIRQCGFLKYDFQKTSKIILRNITWFYNTFGI